MEPKDIKLIDEARAKFDAISDKARLSIYQKVLAHYKKHPGSPWSGAPLRDLEMMIRQFYSDMGLQYDKVFRDTLPPIMQTYYDRAVEEMKTAGIRNAILGKPDSARVKYFLDSAFEQVAMKTQNMIFQHIRALRTITADVTRQMSITGATRRQVSKELLSRAMEIPGFEFIDKSGEKWKLKSYFNMLARTELMNAARTSYDDKCSDEGFDVMKLTTSGNSCEHCAKYEGKLFSLSGKIDGMPSKQDLINDGVFHPNCTHSYSLVSEYIAQKYYGTIFKTKESVLKEAEEQKRKEQHEKHLKHRQEQLERAKANRQERIQQAHQHTLEMQEQFDVAVEEYGPMSGKIQEFRTQYIQAMENEAKVSKKPFTLTAAEKSKITQDAKKRVMSKLQDDLQKQADANVAGRLEIDNNPEYDETFEGIWRGRTVTPKDYAELKDSIQLKREYYQRRLSETSPDLVKKDLLEKMENLKRLEKKGKSYLDTISKLQEAEDNARLRLENFEEKIAPRSSKEAFSQKRKDEAKWFTDENGGFTEAKKLYGKQKSYKQGTEEEKKAAYNYTAGSGHINRPLSGFDHDWGKDHFKGQGKVSWNNESPNGESDIKNLTSLMKKSDYPFDCWLQRGAKPDQLENLMGLPEGWHRKTEKEIKKLLEGKDYINPAFTSCAVDKGAGFSGTVISNFYCPKGTKMLYCAPFSEYPREHEMLLQRGAHFRIIKAEVKYETIYLDIEVHPELGYKS